jgi:acetolactate synthase-1/3 small subunit
MKYIYVISVVTENTMRVLQRMAGIFARHRVNIEQLTVFETSNRGTSYFNIVIHSDTKTVTRVINQLQRIVEVIEAKVSSQIPLKGPNNSESIAASHREQSFTDSLNPRADAEALCHCERSEAIQELIL